MKTFIVFVLIAAGVYAQENVKIETTKKSPIACTRTAKMGDRVSVQYVLSLENGEEIDTSLDKDRPLTITLGQGQVIKGFEQGILGMCFAEERRVTIPPHLGYGDKVHHHQHEIFLKTCWVLTRILWCFLLQEMGPIPANSVLVFDIQLVKIE